MANKPTPISAGKPQIVPIFEPGMRNLNPSQLQEIADLRSTAGYSILIDQLKNTVMKYQVELGNLGLSSEQTMNLVAAWRIAQQFYLEFSQWPLFAQQQLNEMANEAPETPAHNRIYTGIN